MMNIYNEIINNNYIIGEIEIKKEDINKNIQIINSFEEFKSENKIKDNIDNYKNEKEIKESIIIKIDDKIIPFNYYYKFNKEGIYKIKYIFNKKIIKAVCMFYGCKNIKNIDLSKFNTEKVINMNGMFSGC